MSVTVVARTPWAGRIAAVLGILLLAFSLRTAVASLSPVIALVGRDFDVPSVVVGLLGTAPPVCFAVFGIATPALERRFGMQPLVIVALGVLAVGLVLRAFAPNAIVLLVWTAVLFAGVAMGNVLLPGLTKRYFPDRLGVMTTLYATVMSLATFVPPLVAVPVAEAVGWRASVGVWAVFAVLGIVPWIVTMSAGRRTVAGVDPVRAGASTFGRMWRLPLVWALTTGFVVTGTTAYVAFAWLPTILIEGANLTPAEAGAMLALFSAVGLPCSLLAPLIVTRYRRSVGPLFAFAVACGVAGYAGLLLAPAAAPALWVVILGFAPLLFPLVLFLLGQRTRTHSSTVVVSAFVQSVGYAIVALFPLLVGVLHQATGGWQIPLSMMIVVVLLGIPAGVLAARHQTVEDQWERRYGPW